MPAKKKQIKKAKKLSPTKTLDAYKGFFPGR